MPYTYEYPRPSVTVDMMVFSNYNLHWNILLIERAQDPFKGKWALPGGFVDEYESLLAAAERELKEETGLSVKNLKQFKAYGDKGRDPRGWTVSVVFYGICENADVNQALAGSDAANLKWFSIYEIPPMAFDHQQILKEAISSLF